MEEALIKNILFISRTHNFPHNGEVFTVDKWCSVDELEAFNVERLNEILAQLKKDSMRSDW